MATNNLAFDNFFSTTLSSTITASDTTVYLNALPAASEGYLVIEPDSSSNREIIYYTSKGANFVTCPSAASGRGVGGTTAVSHNSGSTVQMNTVAEMFEEIQNGNANTGMHQYFDDSFADYIKSGGAITQATGLIASITSGVSYINGRRLTFNAMSKTLTASKDTYFDLVETDGSNIATISYTELSSGATGSAPVSNGVHLGMVRSNASVLATIYQTGFDILGNPFKQTNAIDFNNLTTKQVGYAQITSNFATASTSPTQVTGLSTTVFLPANSRVKISVYCAQMVNNTANTNDILYIYDGVVGSGTQLEDWFTTQVAGITNFSQAAFLQAVVTASGWKTYNVGMAVSGGTGTAQCSATRPMYILVEVI